ncbi:MAG: D-alanine--D-alanine ligase [Candidatus Kapaibacteriales bacterium]
MKIAVLLGGISTERDISIKSGLTVFKALKSQGYSVTAIDPAFGSRGYCFDENDILNLLKYDQIENPEKLLKNFLQSIADSRFNKFDIAFIALHGKYGEDGTIQSLLELTGIPYTGSGPLSSALAMDKNKSKIIFAFNGIKTPRWVTLNYDDIGNFELYKDIREEFGKAIVIKPNDQGSTVGTTIVLDGNLDSIHSACVEASRYSNTILIERYIEGREITVGILGNKVLPIVEIVPKSGFYDFTHKYTKGKTEYICPAKISEDITEFAQQMALSAFESLGCKGFARADFRLNDEGEPFILEINTIPGLTDLSLLPMAAKEIGIDFQELCKKIIDLSLGL